MPETPSLSWRMIRAVFKRVDVVRRSGERRLGQPSSGRADVGGGGGGGG